jgi:flagellar biosynthesis protein FliR
MRLDLDPVWIETMLLASVRLVAFLIVAPPFGFHGIPIRIKAMLGLGLALAVTPAAVEGRAVLGTGEFLGSIVTELLIGAGLGFIVMIVFSAIQSAGSLLDLFGGFQLAQAFDPASMVNGAQFTRLLNLTALALLFATGGYQLIVLGATSSFAAVPIGAVLDPGRLAEVLKSGLTELFLSALQIAGPLIVVLFLADAGLGLLTRVAPALNAFALGFPLKILITLVLGGLVVLSLPRVVEAMTGDALTGIAGVTR